MTYIEPLEDPAPITPRVATIDITDLPDYATTADEWWTITDRIWPAILDIFERVGMGSSIEALEHLKASRDPGTAEALNAAWVAAPDAGFIHTWPQWGRFCDLCSECHVLFPEDEG